MNYDKTKYRKIDWKHFMMLLWVINPGVAFFELLLGIRIPKVILAERVKNKFWPDRVKVPCPHCNALHDGKTWSPQNKTDTNNRYGLYCPNCHNIIPCVMNITSFLIIAVTAPFWHWFREGARQNWMDKQPERFINLNLNTSEETMPWWLQGLLYGFAMFLIRSVIDIFEHPENMIQLWLINFAVWVILCGSIFSIAMKLISDKFTTGNRL